MAKIIKHSPFELELDWTSPLGPKSNSPISGIGQCPIPTLLAVDHVLTHAIPSKEKKVIVYQGHIKNVKLN